MIHREGRVRSKRTLSPVVSLLLTLGLLLVSCVGTPTPRERPTPISVLATPTSVSVSATPTPVSVPATPTPVSVSATPTPVSVPATPTPIEGTTVPTSTPVETPTTMVTPEFPYGIVYSYGNVWGEAERPAIRERLEYLRSLGVNTVVQLFPSEFINSGREEDWLIFLDEAQGAGLRVVTRLDRGNPWDGRQFEFDKIQSFLAVVKDHPAFLAFTGLHEPMELFNGDQMRYFYSTVKSFAPDVPIVNLMGNQIAKAERNPARADRRFTDGMCDICIFYYYPFQEKGGQPVFQRETLVEVINTTVELVRSRDSDAQVWFVTQAFASPQHRLRLRMPTADEMLELADIVLADRKVDGFFWYQYQKPGRRPEGFQALGDPEMSAQREAVKEIFEGYVRGLR